MLRILAISQKLNSLFLGGTVVVRKLDGKEIITLREAIKLHNEYHFIFIITENVDYCGGDSKGYVLYTYEKPWELSSIPKEEIDEKFYGLFHGYSAYPEYQIGGVYYNYED